MDRKKKLEFIQLTLLFFGILLIYFTYYNKTTDNQNKTVLKTAKDNLPSSADQKDTFSNVEYTGLDLNGNRYLLKSEEAYLDDEIKEKVYMRIVDATFYFKDNTILYIKAENGIFNNKTLDMKFENNVEATYLNSKLFADKAEYLNTKNYLKVYENVRVKDTSGNLIADKLIFDITEQRLDISSLKNNRINANVNLNEKRF